MIFTENQKRTKTNVRLTVAMSRRYHLKLGRTQREIGVNDRLEKENVQCFQCRKYGHVKSECRMKDEEKSLNKNHNRFSRRKNYNTLPIK